MRLIFFFLSCILCVHFSLTARPAINSIWQITQTYAERPQWTQTQAHTYTTSIQTIIRIRTYNCKTVYPSAIILFIRHHYIRSLEKVEFMVWFCCLFRSCTHITVLPDLRAIGALRSVHVLCSMGAFTFIVCLLYVSACLYVCVRLCHR